MWRCIICAFWVEADDAIAPGASGRCVCLRCFNRETQGERPMPKKLRDMLRAALPPMPEEKP